MVMLHLDELRELSISEQFFVFSDAYLRAAGDLCMALSQDSSHRSYADGAVVMSLAYHSLELFLKAAILKRVNDEELPRGRRAHDLEYLHKRFTALYPEPDYGFDIPFRHQTIRSDDFDERITEELSSCVETYKKQAPPEQVNRYPADRDFKRWEGAFAFMPDLFLSTLIELEENFSRVYSKLAPPNNGDAADTKKRHTNCFRNLCAAFRRS